MSIPPNTSPPPNPAPASTPPYYPPLWTHERLLNSAATGDFDTLTETQLDTFRQGLLAHLGHQGYDEFFDELFRREQLATGEPPPPAPPIPEPPFMATMRLPNSNSRWSGPWGFLIYKSLDINPSSPRWSKCKSRLMEIVTHSASAYKGYPGLEDCLSRLSFTFIEDATAGDVASAMRAYAALDPKPAGSDHSVCLFVSLASLDSILDVPLPLAADGRLVKRRYRKEIPFVVALSEKDDDGEEEDWPGYFNVAVESLITDLFPAIAEDSLTPWELGGYVAGEDVWCEIGRYGLHKAGVGYWDKRTQQRPE